MYSARSLDRTDGRTDTHTGRQREAETETDGTVQEAGMQRR